MCGYYYGTHSTTYYTAVLSSRLPAYMTAGMKSARTALPVRRLLAALAHLIMGTAARRDDVGLFVCVAELFMRRLAVFILVAVAGSGFALPVALAPAHDLSNVDTPKDLLNKPVAGQPSSAKSLTASSSRSHEVKSKNCGFHLMMIDDCSLIQGNPFAAAPPPGPPAS